MSNIFTSAVAPEAAGMTATLPKALQIFIGINQRNINVSKSVVLYNIFLPCMFQEYRYGNIIENIMDLVVNPIALQI